MATDDRRTRGAAAFERIMGFPVPTVGDDPFLAATVEHLFAEVWTRPALSVRDRRLITLTVLMTMAHEPTLRLHLGAALRSKDLTPAEVDELILHVAHYAGWPPAALAAQVARQLRAGDHQPE
jgi:4-carboxymuconolactone decarboxylase